MGKKPQSKNKISVDERSCRDYGDLSNDNSISNRNCKSDGATESSNMNEWKPTTIIDRKKLINSTNASVQQQQQQQQCRTKATGPTSGPTSPTEATIAPLYYNGNSMESRNGEHF